MELKLIAAIIFFLRFFAFKVEAEEPATYDITKYGAKPDADISQALQDAWKEASNTETPSVVVIPEGTWSLSQVRLQGNKAPLELKVEGTLKAPPGDLPEKEGQWITINYVDQFTLSGGVFDGQGKESWNRECVEKRNCPKTPMNLSFNFIKNSVIEDMTSKDSKNWHMNCISSQNVTFRRITIEAPGDSPNTDGLHISRVTGLNVIDSVIGTGDDCISMGDNNTEIHIENVTCGPGHGISIGSLGKGESEKDVKGVSVKNCTFIGTDNGVRVKTWPSAPATLQISDLHFEDLIMDNVRHAVALDQQYCPHKMCKLDKPSLIQIRDVTIKNIKGTSSDPEAMIISCSSSKPCENLEIGDIDLQYNGDQGPITAVCQNAKPKIVGNVNPPVNCDADKSGKDKDL